MPKEADRVREDIEALVTQAYQQDAEDDAALGSRRGDELPAEFARRTDRLALIKAAMQRLEARAKANAEAERQRRADVAAARQRTGTTRRGKAPQPVDKPPDAKAQTTFTDPALQIMRTNNKGWEYGGNAQASVDAAYQIIVACDVTTESHDTQPAAPMAQLTVAHLERAGMAMPTDAAGAARRFRPPMTAAMTARQPPRPWSRKGVIRPWPRAVSDTMPPRRRCRSHRHRQGAHGGESADTRRTSPVRSAQSDRGTGVWPDQRTRGFRRLLRVWPTSVVSGVWYV